MDEEDSQDELINRNVSHGKGKRPAMSIISDDEDKSEDEGESEEGETGSEEDDDDEQEEILEEEDEEDESDDDDSGKVLEGAVGNVVDAVGLSSDEDSEKCPICLNSFHEQPVATPETCEHYFCLDCILEWSKNANSCPVDRIVFSNIILRNCHGGKVQRTIAVKKPVKPGEEQVEVDLDQTSCEVCGGRDREDRLLLCDGCDAGYHMECLTPPLDAVPVEEWFCPECITSNHISGVEQISEEEGSSLPTTSRSLSRPTRAIARTQQSERVRANVNRHRITQARTAAQLAPRYMMQSTWLDETINAVVAGLNTAVYVRDLTPRSRPRRKRKTVKRRRTKSKSSAIVGGKPNMGVKRRKRKVRKSKLRRKLVVKKETNSRGRIARSLRIKKPKSGSHIPSVYCPSEYSLGSMRAEIGAASLSVYGDPFDLDPFNDREDEIQILTPSSVLDAKRRGLSHSALRSHQPVARPISASLSRQGVSNPHLKDSAEEAPVSDLLGSILSGQSMLLMDSSDVVINRDGSLKATKPVSLSLPRNTIPTGSGETGNISNSETSLMHTSKEAGPSSSPLRRPPPVHSSTPQNPTSLCTHSLHHLHSRLSPLGCPRLHTEAPRPVNLNPQRHGNGGVHTNEVRGQSLSRVSNGPSTNEDKDGTALQPPIRKPPPKPVWVDVSVLPRIPKIKRDITSSASSSSDSQSSTLPLSSMSSLTGNTGQERTVNHRGTVMSQQNRTVHEQGQRANRTGVSSLFSSSFTSTTSSFSASSNSQLYTSSVSFRINSSGNPWQARRLSASGGSLSGNDEEAINRNNKSKQMLLSLRTKAKQEKCEVYDPFKPTGSDSSDNELEGESRVPVGLSNQIKTEPVEVKLDLQRGSGMCAELKTEPDPFRDKPCEQSPHHSDGINSQSRSRASVVNFTICKASMDAGSRETKSPFMKTQEYSRSCLSCSEENVKLEVKSPAKLQATEMMCKELPSVSGAFFATSITMDKEERLHQSQCWELPQANLESLPSKDSHKKRHSRSKERRRSHSRSGGWHRSPSESKEKQGCRSKENRHLQSRDKRCSSSSSSRERRSERDDNQGRKRQSKGSEERRHSQSCSLSRSRSRERRRTSIDHHETRLKRQKSKSRSTSRERKKQADRLENSLHTESSQGAREPMSTELHELAFGANESTASVKTERDARGHYCEITPVKELKTQFGDIMTPRTPNASKEDASLELCKPKEIKQEELWPVSAVKELKDIKKEEELCFNLFGELDDVKEMKKEELVSVDIFTKKSPNLNEIKLNSADLEKSYGGFQEVQEIIIKPKKIKTECIWPEDANSPSCDNPLVINLDTPDIDAVHCKKEPTELYQLPPLENDLEMSPLQPPDLPIKPEPVISSDEDSSIDYLIDNLDFIKKELSESSMPNSAEAVNAKSIIAEASADNKQITETVTAGVKSKLQGKRVTWNLQETVEPQSEKLSKLALFKLKLKQEGLRRSATSLQTSSQGDTKLTATDSSLPPQDESIKPKSHKEVLHQPNQKEKYMKKLHMQERAIEEVKLAIKPFYQKRDITKEEYKEILRKAVQKVCHSRSGEINPVKVANLVKAYVDKYKHARKHRNEEIGPSQHVHIAKDFKTSV